VTKLSGYEMPKITNTVDEFYIKYNKAYLQHTKTDKYINQSATGLVQSTASTATVAYVSQNSSKYPTHC